ncbi:hypothetical protein PR048_020885 [Dryococelus australis]|uniref:Uncharacterized protein n=1 Tax=Dryococelus australis TaxID=614101 RepID=A0ABQ9GWP0_9NEOP|nr:hypothetical protein PR048_020885 [Dryococelus australis]
MSDCMQYQNLWKAVELLLILVMGNVNKHVEVENLKGKLYIAQSLIYNSLGDIGGVKQLRNLRIIKMLKSCAANACYYLEEQKLAAETAVKRKIDQDGEEIENSEKCLSRLKNILHH